MKKFFAFLAIALFGGKAASAQSAADSLLNFIAANKTRSALYLVQNDTVLAKLNPNTPMPLASTVKIMVAIEFAKQAAEHIVDAEQMIPLSELDKYYLANTDGGAHPAWLNYEKQVGHIKEDKISLLDIARGMIIFSSNANTEYLMDLLGFNNVKNNIQLFGLKQHSSIYPLVGALFMYQNPKQKDEDKILAGIKKLSDEAYSRFIFDMHNALKYNPALKASFRPQDLTMKMQKLWSDRLPSSTVAEYAKIAKILNKRLYLSEAAYGFISEILESLMENPANQQWLKHAGMKGGSTAWVLTKTMYATTQADTRIELAYFFNNLTEDENSQLQHWMNAFELKILTDNQFRLKIKSLLP